VTRVVFVDTAHYVALLNEHDRVHDEALACAEELERAPDIEFTTSEAILMEVLTFVSRLGPYFRARAVDLVDELLSAPGIHVVPVSHELFAEGLRLYRSRPDKTYSIVDCMSMVICRSRGADEVLTTDEDFVREGFRILLGPRAAR
jgi:predicted nucleic acid-binding protein